MSDGTTAYASAEVARELRGDNPSETVRQFAGLVDDREVLRLLNYYDSLLDQPIQETRLGKEILANASTETIDQAVRNGSVAQLKSATGLTGQSEDGADLFGRVAEQLSHEGAIGLVFGPPGAGKTALTIDAARAWQIRTGGALVGNTSWDGFDAQVDSDREMFSEMGSRQGPVLGIIDEAAQDLSGFGASNKVAEKFSSSLLFVRKKEASHGDYAKRGSVLIVAHTRKKTAKSIRRVASFGVEKPSRANPDRARLLESEGGQDTWETDTSYQGITDTAESFPTHEASEFRIEMDDDDSDDGDNDEMDPERREAIKTVLRAVVEQGMNKKDAANLVDFGRHWVGDRVTEFEEDGRYQSLIENSVN